MLLVKEEGGEGTGRVTGRTRTPAPSPIKKIQTTAGGDEVEGRGGTSAPNDSVEAAADGGEKGGDS